MVLLADPEMYKDLLARLILQFISGSALFVDVQNNGYLAYMGGLWISSLLVWVDVFLLVGIIILDMQSTSRKISRLLQNLTFI